MDIVRHLQCDVAVIGGGPAGFGASVAAVKAGASVLLIEQYGFLGGMGPAALLLPWRFPKAHQLMRSSALVNSVAEQARHLGGGRGPFTDPLDSGREIFIIEPEVMKLVLQEIALAAGVELLLHSTYLSAKKSDGRIDSLLLHCQEGKVCVKATVYVDCTGLGLLSCDTAQPISVCTSFVMTGVKEKEVAAYLSDHPDEVRSSFNPSETLLSVQGFASTLACAKETGESLANLQSIALDPGFRPGEVIVRVNHPEKINPLELAPITATELWAQNISIHLAAALRKLVPGLKDSRILMTPAQIGFLGSFRYLLAQVTVKEKAEASHLPFRPQWLVAGNATNLLCAGRAVLQAMGLTSPTNFAPLSMATGESAGRIAAQCVREKISPVKLFALEKI